MDSSAALTIHQSAQRIQDTVEPDQGSTLELVKEQIIQQLEMRRKPPQQSEEETERREQQIDE